MFGVCSSWGDILSSSSSFSSVLRDARCLHWRMSSQMGRGISRLGCWFRGSSGALLVAGLRLRQTERDRLGARLPLLSFTLQESKSKLEPDGGVHFSNGSSAWPWNKQYSHLEIIYAICTIIAHLCHLYRMISEFYTDLSMLISGHQSINF